MTNGRHRALGTALAHLELVALMLEVLPPPETALPRGVRAHFRALQAAETALSWLVGHELGNRVLRLAEGSALGDGWRILQWDDAETASHYESALRDWSERR